MEYTISLASVIGLAVNMLLGLLLSFGLLILLRILYKPAFKSFFVGALMTFVAGYALVQLVHMLVLSFPFGETISNNIWLYSLYVGIVTALVEETARLWSFRSMLKKNTDNDYNALMYGVGQGGAEAIWTLTLGMAANYLVAITIYQGNSAVFFQELTEEETELTILVLNELTQKPPVEIFMMGLERVAYLVMHVALSVIVWFSANKKYFVYKPYLLAIGLRFVFQFAVTLLPLTELSIVLVECIVCVIAAGCAVVAWLLWKREHVPTPVVED